MCPGRVANRMVAMTLAFPAVKIRARAACDADVEHHSYVHAVPDPMISNSQPLWLLDGEPV